MAQLAEGVRLDLADPLARQAELVADLLERPRPAVVEAEAQPDDPLLAALEAVEHPLHLLAEHRLSTALTGETASLSSIS